MDALVASIRDQGQRTPILLRPHPDDLGRYQIAFGHRRYRALQTLGRPVKAKPGVIRIRFDETNLSQDVVEELMSRVRDMCDSLGVRS
jgi:ParB/RepB/Spo0J family partition protein